LKFVLDQQDSSLICAWLPTVVISGTAIVDESAGDFSTARMPHAIQLERNPQRQKVENQISAQALVVVSIVNARKKEECDHVQGNWQTKSSGNRCRYNPRLYVDGRCVGQSETETTTTATATAAETQSATKKSARNKPRTA
jgi:hypothetical protein